MESFLSWKKQLSHESAILKTLPFKLTYAEGVRKVLQALDSSRPCQGNPDNRFMALLPSRKGVLNDHSGMYYLMTYLNLNIQGSKLWPMKTQNP